MSRVILRTFHTRAWALSLCLACSGAPSVCAEIHRGRAAAPVSAYGGEALYRGLVLLRGDVARLIPEIRDHLAGSLAIDDPQLERALGRFHDRLVDAIQALHPRFFTEFGVEVRSGDHLRIEAALARAASVTLDALKNLPEIAALRRSLDRDPDRLEALFERLRADATQSGSPLGAAEEDAAREIIETLVASSLDGETENPYFTDSSIVAVVVAVAAVVAAVTVVAAVSYAAAVNVVVAAVFAVTIVVSGGSGPRPRKSSFDSLGLLREQIVDSIARRLSS